MTKALLAVVGAAETTQMGTIPNLSQIGLQADAALNACRDAGIIPQQVDGLALAGGNPVDLAQYLGMAPAWVDGTPVGGCSFLMHVRHAAAAIRAGYCQTVLVVHGESGRSRIGKPPPPFPPDPTSLAGQFEAPFGGIVPPTMFTVPVLRYLHTHGLTPAALAEVVVAQRRWAALNPRAKFKEQLTVDQVLADRPIAWPFTLPMCCPQTDGGGALVLVSPERARDFPGRPVFVIGTGEATETGMISQMVDFTTSRAFRASGRAAFDQAGISHSDVDHLMIYDAFAHLPLYGLEDLGFCAPGEAAGYIAAGHTSPGGRLPVNTNGGGIAYMHSGMYGMYVMQECVRQMRGIAPAQVPGARVSVAHGVGGMFGAAATLVFTNEG